MKLVVAASARPPRMDGGGRLRRKPAARTGSRAHNIMATGAGHTVELEAPEHLLILMIPWEGPEVMGAGLEVMKSCVDLGGWE